MAPFLQVFLVYFDYFNQEGLAKSSLTRASVIVNSCKLFFRV